MEAAVPPLGVPTLGCRRRGAGAGAAGGGGAGGGRCRRWGWRRAGGGSQKSVAMSEKLADHGVLVPVVPPGAVPGSPGPDTTIPTPAINAAAAMRMPGRRYHGEAASVSSAVRVARGVASNTFIAHPPGRKPPRRGFPEYTSCLQTRAGIGQTGAQVVLCHGIAFCELSGARSPGFRHVKVSSHRYNLVSSRGLLEISSGARRWRTQLT